MLIDASHAEETRVVVLDGNRLEDFDLEAANRLPLKGNIYLAKVVRVEPSLQAAFVEYGGNRHGFLPLAEIHPDYYQIPVADRQRLLAMQAAEAREEEAAEEAEAASERAEATEGAEAEPDRAEGTEAEPDPAGTTGDGGIAAAAETAAEAGGSDDDDAGREAEAGRAGGSEVPAKTPAEAGEPPRSEEPEPVLIASPAQVEAVAEAEPAPFAAVASDPEPAAGDAPQAAEEAPGAAAEDTAPVPDSAAAGAFDTAAAEAAPSGEEATIAKQSGPFLLPGEGEQPSVGPVTARNGGGAPNGHADEFEHDDAPPPEDIGGEGPEEVARERRAPRARCANTRSRR
jgi:ribonuclease E